MDTYPTSAVPAGFIRRSDFGSDFIFGSSTSAFQVEGANKKDGRGPCIWDSFATEKDLFHPYGEDAVNHYEKYEEDVELMKDIGFDAYRFSISWSRVLPSGEGFINQAGIEFYKKLLRKLKDKKMKTFVTLLHFDPPEGLEIRYNGFLNRKIVEDFGNYADLCFREFGGMVDYWITINEPWSVAYGAYIYNIHAPGRGTVKEELLPPESSKSLKSSSNVELYDYHGVSTILPCRSSIAKRSASEELLLKQEEEVSDTNVEEFVGKEAAVSSEEQFKEPYIVAHHMLLAHAKAVDIYRKKYQEKYKGKIGIALNSMWYPPFKTDDPLDVEASKRAMDFMLGWLMEPLVRGEYPARMKAHVTQGHLPEIGDDRTLIAGSYDFIGMNYYTGRYVSHQEKKGGNYVADQKVLFCAKAPDGRPIGEEQGGGGWLFSVPKGLMELLKYIKDNYNNPLIYITENGIDDRDDNSSVSSESLGDHKRQKFIHDHLSFLLKGKNELKVNVEGYFVWSLLDNLEWAEGFKARFGIIYVDYRDKARKRYLKESAEWLKKFLAN